MKRSKAFRLTLFIMSALCVLSLLSCREDNGEAGEDDFIIGSATACIYGDTVYYFNPDAATFMYQQLDDMIDGGVSMYSDVLAENEENPFAQMFSPIFLIDEKATRSNGDRPVIIITHSYPSIEHHARIHRILSYNTKTGKTTVIKDNIFESVQSTDLYGDYIYYTTNEGELGYNVHRINKDGSGYIKMDNPDEETFRIVEIYKNHIYLRTETGQLYKTTLSFEDKEPLFEVFGRVDTFIIDDYIIYDANPHVVGDDDNTMYAVDICRSPLSDLTVTETLIEDVYIGMDNGAGEFYYYITRPRRVGPDIIDPGTDVLYEYSFDTLSSRVVYDLQGKNVMKYYIAFSDDYIVYDEYDFSDGSGSYYLTAQNLKTNKETKALY